MKASKAITLIMLISLLVGCIKSTKDNFFMIYYAPEDLVVIKSGQVHPHGLTMAFDVPLAYELRREEYIITIEVNEELYHSHPTFNVKAKSSDGNYYYIKSKQHPQDCLFFAKRGITFDLMPKNGFDLIWELGKEGTACQNVADTEGYIDIELYLYDSEQNHLHTEHLNAQLIRNGIHRYK